MTSSVAPPTATAEVSSGPFAAQATALRHAWGTEPALLDVTLALRPGCITGFLGRNGAGKSTTLKILAGAVVPDAGVAVVGGVPAHEGRARREVGWAPEEPPTAAGLTVREQLVFVARLRRLTNDVPGHIARLLDSLDLTSVETRLCGALSRGTRQRVGLAMALLGNPRVLLLDEPTAGLDPAQIAQLRDLLLRRRDEGVAILLSSHVTAELEALVDDVVVVDRGRTVLHVPRSDLARAVAVLARSGEAGEAAPEGGPRITNAGGRSSAGAA
jgi:ABC-2 type transport system ATP-binding protein